MATKAYVCEGKPRAACGPLDVGNHALLETKGPVMPSIYELENEFSVAGDKPEFIGNMQGFRISWDRMNKRARAALTRGENKLLRRRRLWALGKRRNGYHPGHERAECLAWRDLDGNIVS
jgi:hypothetical protein